MKLNAYCNVLNKLIKILLIINVTHAIFIVIHAKELLTLNANLAKMDISIYYQKHLAMPIVLNSIIMILELLYVNNVLHLVKHANLVEHIV